MWEATPDGAKTAWPHNRLSRMRSEVTLSNAVNVGHQKEMKSDDARQFGSLKTPPPSNAISKRRAGASETTTRHARYEICEEASGQSTVLPKAGERLLRLSNVVGRGYSSRFLGDFITRQEDAIRHVRQNRLLIGIFPLTNCDDLWNAHRGFPRSRRSKSPQAASAFCTPHPQRVR
jgi:hypothetical protein